VERRRERLESRVLSVTMDDSEAELNGGWRQSNSVARFVGDSYSYTSEAGATAVYEIEIPRTGRYQVRASHSPHPNRGDRVPITVHHADGTDTVRVDQTQDPPLAGLYEPVGTYRFRKGETARIVISTEDAGGTSIADAVRLVATSLDPAQKEGPRLPDELPGVIVDDTEAERIGNWRSSTFYDTYVGEGYIHDGKQGKGENAVVFEPDLPRSGTYELRLSYTPGGDRAGAVPVTVHHAGGKERVEFDESSEPPISGLFRAVGRFRFEAGEGAKVRIDTDGTEGEHVIVDAAQFIPVNDAGELVIKEGSGSDSDKELAEVERRLAEAEQRITELRAELKELENNAPDPPPQAMAAKEQDNPGDYHVCLRGDAHNLGPKVERGYLSVITDEPANIPEGQSGRLQLARWLTGPENPLTARVMVNRIWHHLFGRGIVRTVDNFGNMGEAPSHPELLDYLASRFIEDGWSVKSTIRRVVLSRTDRQSIRATERAERIEPGNKLLSHMSRRRLEAECIRDAMLSIAGNLDPHAAGRAFPEDLNAERNYRFAGETRRSVYLPVFRYNIPDLYDVFDFANPSTVVGQRSVSTLPTQALFLMNSDFVLRQARRAAARLLEDPDTLSDRDRLEKAYVLALGRPPTDDEREAAMEHLEQTVGSVAAAELNEKRREAWAGIM
jgi:hypothetical protein